jgi:exopolysaccharide biosynthesis polyprenyl glycosylphosphotransferase
VPGLQIHFWGAATFLTSTLVFLCVARAGARAIACRRLPPERVLFVGGGPMASLLVRKIRAHPEYGLEPIGFVDRDGEPSDLESSIPYLGSLEDAETICRQAGVGRIVIASPSVNEATLADIVRVTGALDVRMSILPQLSDVLGPSVAIDDVEGITVLGLNPPALSPSSRLLKRAMDLALALTALAVLFPLMCSVALGIRLTSAGPVFYTQERIGRKGRRFRIYKFRTMIVDADARAEELKRLSAHPAWLLLEHDPRVTRLGRILRRSSLDELPQLWNVVRGEMSLVGPRPMPPDVDERISGWGRRRLDLTPGITGLWQVLGRTNIPFEEMVKLDYLYVTNWSLWQDVRLLIQTLPAVTSQRGVN